MLPAVLSDLREEISSLVYRRSVADHRRTTPCSYLYGAPERSSQRQDKYSRSGSFSTPLAQAAATRRSGKRAGDWWVRDCLQGQGQGLGAARQPGNYRRQENSSQKIQEELHRR